MILKFYPYDVCKFLCQILPAAQEVAVQQPASSAAAETSSGFFAYVNRQQLNPIDSLVSKVAAASQEVMSVTCQSTYYIFFGFYRSTIILPSLLRSWISEI